MLFLEVHKFIKQIAMIQIVLVDDHHLVRSGFRLILETQDDITVLADVESAEAALDVLNVDQRPDIILTDINMGEMGGIALIDFVKQKYPDIKILALTMENDKHIAADVLRAGADGYLVKDSSCDEVLFGIRQVAKGEKYISGSLSVSCLNDYKNFADRAPDLNRVLLKYDISERELHVLELIAQGYTNGEIAERIFLSKRTVEGHRQKLIEKTNTKNTAGLVSFGFHHMLLH
ncbi:Nitrogen regulation protein C [Sphingobacterium multivorum]|uniref:Nitrogen regulation protein C n=3 Tax=Sphingobacteriaceae TaxID=84566 RepID=A0A654DIX7_SPHMU|nr:Nitrogen regulation protein C [Sphingobacterium multivorum]VXD05277.1 Nitrogen regulation protein C [Sphingobacterium multivorum]